MSRSTNNIRNGLVLPGGGARAAYQVGVLKAASRILPKGTANPFPVIAGTSAGAVNAAVLASRASNFALAVRALERVWGGFHANQVFKTGAWTMLRSSLHWLAALTLGGLGVGNPRSLLDNSPLEKLLAREIRFDQIAKSVAGGSLDALAVTLSGYSSARSITFFEGRDNLAPWQRTRREGRRDSITLKHLMATVAIPFVFPPCCLGQEFFGDGVMRQTAPLAPAIHLGAQRLLVIGVRDAQSNTLPESGSAIQPPTLGQIGGYLLDNLFMDWLYADLERLTRTNQLLGQINGASRSGAVGSLRQIETMVILPSQDIREIARRHAHNLPRPVRMLLSGLGAGSRSGSQLVSYMLFESSFTRELVELGYADAMTRSDELENFLTGQPAPLLDVPTQLIMGLSS